MERQSNRAAYSLFPDKAFVRIIEHFRQEFVLCVRSFRFAGLHEDLYVFKKNRGEELFQLSRGYNNSASGSNSCTNSGKATHATHNDSSSTHTGSNPRLH
jgi:hypothetical protein